MVLSDGFKNYFEFYIGYMEFLEKFIDDNIKLPSAQYLMRRYINEQIAKCKCKQKK